MVPTSDSQGYWLVAADGGVFSFGNAQFYGSTGGTHLAEPIVGLTPTPDGAGYWLVAADGGVFAYGNAQFYGSTGGNTTSDPAQKIVADQTGLGYWIVDQNGTMWGFGDVLAPPSPQGLLFNPVTPGDKAVLWAFTQLGKPYIWGGNGPVGYDCSGLALASYEHADDISFARVSDNQSNTAGAQVAMSNLQAGDLVFWATDPTNWTTVDHTAVYVGGGQIVESTGGGVQLNTLDQWGPSEVINWGRQPWT
jgi:hypothetical protein